MTSSQNLPITSILQKKFPELTHTADKTAWLNFFNVFFDEKNAEITRILDLLLSHTEILSHQKDRTSMIVAFLEEAGGLTVRARNHLSASPNSEATKKAVAEFQDWFGIALNKLNLCVQESSFHNINLLDGDTLETVLDLKGHTTLLTPGIKLSASSLGIRDADFSNLFSVQNSRIDVMNALDIAVSLRNTIATRISELKTIYDFGVEAIHRLENSAKPPTALELKAEADGLETLIKQGNDFLNGERLAEPKEQQILDYFSASPSIEDI